MDSVPIGTSNIGLIGHTIKPVMQLVDCIKMARLILYLMFLSFPFITIL